MDEDCDNVYELRVLGEYGTVASPLVVISEPLFVQVLDILEVGGPPGRPIIRRDEANWTPTEIAIRFILSPDLDWVRIHHALLKASSVDADGITHWHQGTKKSWRHYSVGQSPGVYEKWRTRGQLIRWSLSPNQTYTLQAKVRNANNQESGVTTFTFEVGDVAPTIRGPASPFYYEDWTKPIGTYHLEDSGGHAVSGATWSLAVNMGGIFLINSAGELNFRPGFRPSYNPGGPNSYEATVNATVEGREDPAPRPVTVLLRRNTVGAVRLTGIDPATPDELITAELINEDDNPTTPTWSWERLGLGSEPPLISGDASYTPGGDDVGRTLRVTATYDDDHDSGVKVWREFLVSPKNTNPRITFEGADPPRVDTPVTAVFFDPDDAVVTAWAWTRISISTDPDSPLDDTDATYSPGTEDLGHKLQVTATYNDTFSSGESASHTTLPVEEALTNPPPETNEPPVLTKISHGPVTENTETEVAVFRGTDPEEQSIEWTLEDTNPTDLPFFEIREGPETDLNELHFKAAPDYEERDAFTVVVKITDQGGLTAEETVSVVVVNDPEPGSITIEPETPQACTHVMATLRDPDGGIDLEAANSPTEEPTFTYGWVWDSRYFPSDGPRGPVEETSVTQSRIPSGASVGQFLEITTRYGDNAGDRNTVLLRTPTVVANVPRTPVNLQAVSGDASVALSWLAPDNNCGSTITGYEYRYRRTPSGPAPAGPWSIHSTPNLFETVTGLTNEIEYEFRVRAQIEEDDFGLAAVKKATPRSTNRTPVLDGPTSVAVNEKAGTLVGSYRANDDNTVVWTYGGTDREHFDLNMTSTSTRRELHFKQVPDFEARSSYSIWIRITDPTGLFDQETISIAVNNVDEGGTIDFSPSNPTACSDVGATLVDLDGGVVFSNPPAGVSYGWFWMDETSSRRGQYPSIMVRTGATPVRWRVKCFRQVGPSVAVVEW